MIAGKVAPSVIISTPQLAQAHKHLSEVAGSIAAAAGSASDGDATSAGGRSASCRRPRARLHADTAVGRCRSSSTEAAWHRASAKACRRRSCRGGSSEQKADDWSNWSSALFATAACTIGGARLETACRHAGTLHRCRSSTAVLAPVLVPCPFAARARIPAANVCSANVVCDDCRTD